MRFRVWTWRVVLTVVVGAFVATAYYMTHDVGTRMDRALPALDLITVIGSGLLGAIWIACRRYWYALILLVALGLLRGLFGFGTQPLVTDFQSTWLFVSIGFVGLVLLVTLTARVVKHERALKAAAGAGTIQIPAQTITAVGPVSSPIPSPVSGQDTAVMEAVPRASAEQGSAILESTAEE